MTITTLTPIQGCTSFELQWRKDEVGQAQVSLVPANLVGTGADVSGYLANTYVCQITNWDSPEAEIRSELLLFPQLSGANFGD